MDTEMVEIAAELHGLIGDDVDDMAFTIMVDAEVARRRAELSGAQL